MAFSAILKPSDYFTPTTFTGTSSTQTVTTGTFQPDLTWFKSRFEAEAPMWFDSVRGAGYYIASNNYNPQSYNTSFQSAWTSTGVTVGTAAQTNGEGAMICWNWKAGTTSGIATDGDTTITPTGYSFNQTSGFSIIKYTGNGVDGAYLPHGLGKTPKVMIVKRLVDTGWDWYVYHASMGNQKYIQLNETSGISSTNGMWGSYTPTSVNMKMSNDAQIGASGKDYVMYCFADIAGYSKFSQYVGNGNANGTFVYTGFKPSWVMIKSRGSGQGWCMKTAKSNNVINGNVNNYFLQANQTNIENTSTDSSFGIDMVSNGFKLRNTDGIMNTNGENYIYMAFAETPFVANSGESIPTTAR
jgi:hypothetical protein